MSENEIQDFITEIDLMIEQDREMKDSLGDRLRNSYGAGVHDGRIDGMNDIKKLLRGEEIE